MFYSGRGSGTYRKAVPVHHGPRPTRHRLSAGPRTHIGERRMRESETGATFRGYLLTVRRRRWWVIVFTLLAGGVSLTFSLSQPDEYSATAQILVQSSTDATTPGS